MSDSTDNFNALLDAAVKGEKDAAELLFPIVYRELHRIASGYMERERANHTLQPTALIHEAFLTLTKGSNDNDGAGETDKANSDAQVRDFQNRAHFINTAALVMRRILVNHAKAKNTQKRGMGQSAVSLDQVAEAFAERSIDLIALDEAMQELSGIDPVQHQLVELRFFAGVSNKEAADIVGISERSAYSEWAHARAWLQTRVSGE